MNAKEYLDNSLKHVESNSIREWVKTEHNYPLWLKLAQGAVDKKTDELSFSTYIVCVAIGL